MGQIIGKIFKREETGLIKISENFSFVNQPTIGDKLDLESGGGFLPVVEEIIHCQGLQGPFLKIIVK